MPITKSVGISNTRPIERVRQSGSGSSRSYALDVEDLKFDATRRLRIMLGKSKSDQDQAGAQIAVP